jgi:sulfonate transport system permease protein
MSARHWHASRLGTLALGVAFPAALALAWQAAAIKGIIDSSIWASPWLVAKAMATQVQDPRFWTDIGASLWRDAQGTALGILLGLIAGLALGCSALVRDFCGATLDAAKAVPIFTWVPLLSVWFGSGEAGKITFIALVTALPVLFNTAEGVLSLEARYLELIRLYHLGRVTKFRRVVLPGAGPAILRGVHQAVLYGWLATIGAEFLFEAGNGIGANINGAKELYALDFVIADMLAIGLIGIAFDLGFGRIERFLLRWREDRPA